jgi:hypothetical protein
MTVTHVGKRGIFIFPLATTIKKKRQRFPIKIWASFYFRTGFMNKLSCGTTCERAKCWKQKVLTGRKEDDEEEEEEEEEEGEEEHRCHVGSVNGDMNIA